jgi:hypothetical protein
MQSDYVDVPIPGDGSLSVRGRRASSSDVRFADVTLQVAGFMLNKDGNCITSFRWIPANATQQNATKVTAGVGGDVLRCFISARSMPFIRNILVKETVSVLLLLTIDPQNTEIRYDLGDYRWYDNELDVTGSVVLQRVGPAASLSTLILEDPVLITDHQTANPSNTETTLEDESIQLLLRWGVDVMIRVVTFSFPGTDAPFQPTAMLFDVTGDVVHVWCGTANRFGRNVLLVVDDGCPSRARFTQMRSLARNLRFPMLLMYGVGDGRTNDGEASTFCYLLFRPGDGVNQRVHFVWDDVLLRTAIVPRDA